MTIRLAQEKYVENLHAEANEWEGLTEIPCLRVFGFSRRPRVCTLHEQDSKREQMSHACDELSLCLSRLALHDQNRCRKGMEALDEINFGIGELKKSSMAHDEATDHEKAIENQMRIVRSV